MVRYRRQEREIHGLNVGATTWNLNHQETPVSVLYNVATVRLWISRPPRPSKSKHKKLVPSPSLALFVYCLMACLSLPLRMSTS